MRLRLSSRFILSVVLIEAIMLSILVWNSVRLISSSHAQLLEQYVDEQGALLALSLQPGLASNDPALLQDALSLLRGNAAITYIEVKDRRGRQMAKLGTQTSKGQPDYNYQEATRDGVFDITRRIELYGQQLGTLQVGYAIDHITQLTTTTRRQNTLIAAIELFLTITLTVLLGLFLTRNLRKLEQGAEALGREELDHRIQLHANDEIGDVANAFNHLAEHLQATRAALKREDEQLRHEKQRMESLLDNINAVVMEVDSFSMDFTYVSQVAETLLGFPVENWLEPGFWVEHLHPDDCQVVIHSLREQRSGTGDNCMDYRLQHRNGEYIWVRSIYNTELGTNHRPIIRGLLIDINQQKETEQRIVFLANHDPLTGMYNRRRFQEQLERQIAYANRYKVLSALLFIDLDQFKYINDTLGHQAGDQCLTAVSHALKSSLRESDVLGRLGGDEFGVILPQTDSNGAEYVAQKLVKVLEQQVQIPAELNMHISASIGITLFPEQGTTPAELLAKADAAMYTIKRSGRGKIHTYQPDDQELVNMKAKVQWEDRITRALQDDLFLLHFQPIIGIHDNLVSHHEALLRLRDDNGELIYPGAFLDTAERYGLIRDVDQWVIKKAIQVQGESIQAGQPVSLAVNLSGRNFGDPDFMDLVQSALEYYKADPQALIFEVTETAAVENFKTARRFVEDLRSLGCRLALDDFGMGYSSFQYLKNLPVDMVKIDGSFIRHIHQNRTDQVIVNAMCDLARGMNIVTVAEFVESEDVLQQLKLLGVNYAQGYHIAMPSETFIHAFDDQLQQVKA